MFGKKDGSKTAHNKKLKESDYLDGLCDLVIDRLMNEFMETMNKNYFVNESVDRISTDICQAIVKDVEHELWVRIAPKVLERVKELKLLAQEATGEHKKV